MNIIFEKTNDSRIIGLAQALDALGHHVQLWEDAGTVFDVIELHKPDMLVFNKHSDAIPYIKKEFQNIKTILISHEIKDEYDLHISLIQTNDGLYLPYLANTITQQGGEIKEQYKCDLSIITNDCTDNKIINIIGHNVKAKAYGEHIQSVYYLGSPIVTEYKHIFASSEKTLLFNYEHFYNAIFNNCKPIIYSKTNIKDIITDNVDTSFFLDTWKNREKYTYTAFAKKLLEII